MTVDACFVFRGDIRYDTRLRNVVRAFVRSGNSCLVIQGAAATGTFTHEGASVESFASRGRGAFGFLSFWLAAARRVARVRAKAFWAADLYSLPIVLWGARRCGGRTAYDSRELFAHLGALKRKRAKQKFWYGLERTLIGGVDAVITSGEMDSDYIEERYEIARPFVVRNLPPYRPPRRTTRLHDALGLQHDAKICLYAGGLQEGRGIAAMLAMAGEAPEGVFVFMGDGPLAATIEDAARRLPNVRRLAAVPNDELIDYVASASLGFALIEPITLSYLLALPNKLFEYIMAGTPVVVTDLPQMETIVEHYGVGVAIRPDCAGDMLAATRELLANDAERQRLAANCLRAAQDLCWENEEKMFLQFAHEKGLL